MLCFRTMANGEPKGYASVLQAGVASNRRLALTRRAWPKSRLKRLPPVYHQSTAERMPASSKARMVAALPGFCRCSAWPLIRIRGRNGLMVS